MATAPKFEVCCEAEAYQSLSPVQDMYDQGTDPTEKDYDFVEQPDQDFYCPVSLEILLQPHQTLCCGHHISQQAANRLVREGKPCPMCKNENFTTQVDKYFKRKVHQLKVRCPHKKSGCDWIWELGDLNLHSTSCPKRPWKCQHCDFESTYEVGINNHASNCIKYPQPCPNQCEIGSVPRCDLEKHLLVCSLQLVECEFAHSGCDVKVPRRVLARHMTEGAQHHLMTATLLNLQLTRELHQKMEEKDQQIVDLQQQVKQLETDMTKKLWQQTVELDTKLQQQTKDFKAKLQLETANLALSTSDTHKKMDNLSKNLEYSFQGFTSHEFTLTDFNKRRASKNEEENSWFSEPFYCYPRGYRFRLNIETNGYSAARGTHLSAFLYLQTGDYDKELKWPINVTIHLEMVNQRRDEHHYVMEGKVFLEKPGNLYTYIKDTKFFPLADLGCDLDSDTEYLIDDKLQFRLYLKVEK